jgi:hypothetical protein
VNVFLDDVIHIAARWIAGQRRELHEGEIPDTREVRERHYLDVAKARLGRAAKQCEGSPEKMQIGCCVTCGKRADGSIGTARVIVQHDRIYGYVDLEPRPSFIWPPDLAERLRAKWATNTSEA